MERTGLRMKQLDYASFDLADKEGKLTNGGKFLTDQMKPETFSTTSDFRVILKNANYNLVDGAHQDAHQVDAEQTVDDQVLDFCSASKSKKKLLHFMGLRICGILP